MSPKNSRDPFAIYKLIFVLFMQPASKTDGDVHRLFDALVLHYKSQNNNIRCAFFPADSQCRAIARISIKNRLFVLQANGNSFVFTEPSSADKDYTINNLDELTDTIDDIIVGWQPRT